MSGTRERKRKQDGEIELVFVDVPGRLGRGAVGSSNLAAASIGAEKITYGSLGIPRMPYQTLGTHLAGSMQAGTLKQRYAVWPQAFANANYRVYVGLEMRNTPTGTAALRSLFAAAARRTTGSMLYWVHNSAGAALPMPGTVHITGIAQ